MKTTHNIQLQQRFQKKLKVRFDISIESFDTDETNIDGADVEIMTNIEYGFKNITIFSTRKNQFITSTRLQPVLQNFLENDNSYQMNISKMDLHLYL